MGGIKFSHFPITHDTVLCTEQIHNKHTLNKEKNKIFVKCVRKLNCLIGTQQTTYVLLNAM